MEVMFDADGHIFESGAEIVEYLDAPYSSRKELLRDNLFPPMDSWNRAALSIRGGYLEGSNSNRSGREGSVERWIEFLDESEIEGTVLYPTRGLGFGRVREVEWSVALARAYNTWIHEKFMNASPRFKAMALIPVLDPPQAASELRRAVTELGMVGGVVIAGGKRPFGDPFYFPIYEAAQELDTVIAVHAGGPGNRFEMLDRAIDSRCLGHPTSLMIEMTSMMFSGVFDLYPRLRFAFLEGGIAWALAIMERMQEAYDQWGVQAPELKREPKEHLTSGRIFFHTELDEDILPYAAQKLGPEALLYASDYPHINRGRIRTTLSRFLERGDVAPETKTAILGRNARRLYKLREPALA